MNRFSIATPYELGYRAAMRGLSAPRNPYPAGTTSQREWNRGRNDYAADQAGLLTLPDAPALHLAARQPDGGHRYAH